MSQLNSPALPYLPSFTTKEASEVLAETAVIGRRIREKFAFLEGAQPYLDTIKGEGSKLLGQAGGAIKNIANPQDNTWEAVRNGLIGAGVGAGAGGLASLTQPRERRRPLSTMMQGALLGGAIGGGGTLAMQHAGVVGKTPDSAVGARIKDLKADVLRNEARGTDVGTADMQAEIKTLQERAAKFPKAAPAAPKPQPSLGTRLNSATTDVRNGELGNAFNTMVPHPGNAALGAGGAGAVGYGSGALVDHGINRMYRGKVLNEIPLTEYKSQLGDVIGEAAKNNMAASKSNILGMRPVPASVKPHVGNLKQTTAFKARPAGKWFRRGGGIAGLLLGSQLGQKPAE